MLETRIVNAERAKTYSTVLRGAHCEPVDVGDAVEIKLPDFTNHDRIKIAQRFFRSNYYAILFSMYMGLLSILAIPSILDVLVHTKKSSSNMTAYKRYMQTIYHTLTWFRQDLQPGTDAWKSLEAVRKFHFSASRSAKNASVGMISQRNMVITQYGFIGFAILSREETGVQGSQEQFQDYCHFWRVIGHMLGIKDEFNLCCATYDETLERLEVVRSEFLLPSLLNPPDNFTSMSKYIANGLWCFDPLDTYNEIIFMAKRLTGVPNYYYLDSEIPENFDRNILEIYKQTLSDRIFIWLSVMTRQFLLKLFITRWFFNFCTLFCEFSVRYFPFLAFIKFGIRNAYVNIK